MTTTVRIDPVTRIEGHGNVVINLGEGKKIESAFLQVQELRGFEKILVGMEIEKMPLVTARICGVCPPAHHVAAAKAVDNVFGVEPPPAAKMLRELMYLGHFIHSHALHFFVLGGPDLILGFDSPVEKRNVLGIVAANAEVAKKALRLRSIGQLITEIIGGRGVHPVTCVAGGITFKMTPDLRQHLKKLCTEGLELAKMTMGINKKVMESNKELMEVLKQETYYLALVQNGKVNFYDGKIKAMDPKGTIVSEFEGFQYKDHIIEGIYPNSYMKPVYFKHNGQEQIYRVNSLARLNCAEGMETPLAEKELQEFRQKFGRPAHKTLLLHYARVIEILYAAEKALMLLENDAINGETRAQITKKPGHGVGVVEAPRGLLFHEYESDEKGRVKKANFIVATQQSYAAINEAIKQAAERFIEKSSKEVLNGVELAIRCYDPCLSCATHALGQMDITVEILREGKTIRRIRRGKDD